GTVRRADRMLAAQRSRSCYGILACRVTGLRPWGTLIDPRAENADLFRSQSWTSDGHHQALLQPCNQLNEPAFRAGAKFDDRARVPAGHRARPRIQAKTAALQFRTMARLAPLPKN